MTQFISQAQKLPLFEELLKVRIASYELQDAGLISDDEITAREEIKVQDLGVEYEEYMDWKDGGREYPTADEIIEKMIESNGILGDINKDADDFVYEAISEFDMFFVDDKNWSDEEDSDVKDSLRDEVMEKLEETGTLVLAGV